MSTADDDRGLVALIDSLVGQNYHSGMSAALSPSMDALCSLFGAGGASVALVSDDGAELEFVSADPETADLIVGVRLPINEGIVGFVVTSGQSLAVSDLTQDPRFARDVAEHVGYIPEAILAAPLMSDDMVLGVVEVLDPSPLTPDRLRDLDVLETAAITLAQIVHAQHALRTPVETFLKLAASDRDGNNPDLKVGSVPDEATSDLIAAIRALMARDDSGLGMATEILRILARDPRSGR